MLPMLLFSGRIFGVIVVGLFRDASGGGGGHRCPAPTVEALSVLLVLKAFAAGCSALTGIEAIANGVPVFREPRAERAQRTELMLGALLGRHAARAGGPDPPAAHAPRGGVTVLAQLTAGSFGTGWAYYATNIIVTLVLALAANTSFGGLPVLMSLLAKDHRLPHLFALRAERPVYRYGVVALALLAAAAADRGATRPPTGSSRCTRSGSSSASPSARPGWSGTGSASARRAGGRAPRSTAPARC